MLVPRMISHNAHQKFARSTDDKQTESRFADIHEPFFNAIDPKQTKLPVFHSEVLKPHKRAFLVPGFPEPDMRVR